VQASHVPPDKSSHMSELVDNFGNIGGIINALYVHNADWEVMRTELPYAAA